MWVDLRQPQEARVYAPKQSVAPKQPDWEAIRAEKEESMTFLNAKNNAAVILAAVIKKGELSLPDVMAKFGEITQWIYEIGKNEKN